MAVTNVSQVWGTPGVIPCSFSLLAAGSLQQSAALDLTNLTNFPNLLDVLIMVQAWCVAAPGDASAMYVSLYGSINGTTFPDSITGTDSAYSGSINNLTPLRQLNMLTNQQSTGNPEGIAAAFSGGLPKKVGLVIQNRNGSAPDGNSGHNQIIYIPIYTVMQ